MMKTFKSLFLLFLLANMAQAQGQKPPFKQQDSINFPGTNKILFVGSSSFTKWTDVQNYFPAYPIVNRGFGGSSLTDVICYEKDIIFPYRPKQIVIYCGENDIAASETVTGKLVFERFKQLFSDIRNQSPGIPVAYISMKPSPSRWQIRNRMIEGNELIEKYLTTEKNAWFLNVWNAMLGTDGKPMKDIFIEDGLHMNAKGYAIWQKLIQPYLVKK
jgi:lysophospholipase L1-like esterase